MSDSHPPATFDDDESTSVVQAADVGGFFGGRFRIDQRLGVGAMGRVLSALDTQTGQLVALKVLHRDRSKDPDVLRRFGREARALSAIAHPAIVGIVASGRAPDGTPWLAMEHLVGKTLKDRIKAGPPMQVAELWPIIKTLAEAMAAAHAAGVVHRDLKPENVFLLDRPPPVAKILDFGLSSLSRENERFTKTGQVLGTPRYMAPELLSSGKKPDQRVDVFALGVIAFEALTGQSMYTADDLGSLFGQILEGRTRPLRSLRPDLSETMEGLIQQATARDPDDRFGTVTAFVTGFGHAAGYADAPAAPAPGALAGLFDDVTSTGEADAPLLDPFSGAALPKKPSSVPVRAKAMTAMGVAPAGIPRPGPAAAFRPMPAPTPLAAEGGRASLKPAAAPAVRPAISGPDGWAHGPTPSAPMVRPPPTTPASQVRPRAITPSPMQAQPQSVAVPVAYSPGGGRPLGDTAVPASGAQYPPAAARRDVTASPPSGVAYPPPAAGPLNAPTVMSPPPSGMQSGPLGAATVMSPPPGAAGGMPAVTLIGQELGPPMQAPAPQLGAAAAPGSAQLSFSAPRGSAVAPAPGYAPSQAPSHSVPQVAGYGAPPAAAYGAPPAGYGASAGAAGAPPAAAGYAQQQPGGFAAPPSASFSMPAPAPRSGAAPQGTAPARPAWVFWAIFGVAAIVVVFVATAGALALRWAMVHGHL